MTDAADQRAGPVSVLTFGCRLNTYESEAMRDLASRALAGSPNEAGTPAPSW